MNDGGTVMTNENCWLIMLYLAADDLHPNNLRPATLDDNCGRLLDGIKKIGHIDGRVKIVALFDDNARPGERSHEYYPSIWSLKSTRDDSDQITTDWIDVAASDPTMKALFPLKNGKPECDTGDFRTLSLFTDWALKKYPCERTMLAIVGHGGGWGPTLQGAHREIADIPRIKDIGANKYLAFSQQGRAPILPPAGMADAAESSDGGGWQKRVWSPGLTGLAPDYSSKPNSAISTQELRLALEYALSDKQGKKIDVLFLDACLMSMIEVAYEVRKCVDYVVAGQNLLWARYPYRSYFEQNNVLRLPDSPEELARGLVENYNIAGEQKSWEVSAIKTAGLPALTELIDRLASTLCIMLEDDRHNELLDLIYNAYESTQKFDYDADLKITSDREGYVDLYDFADKLIGELSKSDDSRKQAAIDIAEKIKCSIGVQFRTVATIIRGKLQLLQNVVNPGCRSQGVIIRARTQSDEDDGNMLLYQAFGLSIYLPLGEEERHSTDANTQLGGKTLFEYYCDPTQLQFTRNVKHWSELVKLLIGKDAARSEHRRRPSPTEYRTPRQRN